MRSAVNEGEYAYTLNFHVSVHQNTMAAWLPPVQTPPCSSHAEAGPCSHSRLPTRLCQ